MRLGYDKMAIVLTNGAVIDVSSTLMAALLGHVKPQVEDYVAALTPVNIKQNVREAVQESMASAVESMASAVRESMASAVRESMASLFSHLEDKHRKTASLQAVAMVHGMKKGGIINASDEQMAGLESHIAEALQGASGPTAPPPFTSAVPPFSGTGPLPQAAESPPGNAASRIVSDAPPT
jgi:hypothetical protein